MLLLKHNLKEQVNFKIWNIYIIYVYVVTINLKEAINLKENKKLYIGGLGGRKGSKNYCNYITTTIIKEKRQKKYWKILEEIHG